ncbi:MAG TPA: cytochrome c-type biogenesis protein [Burkholderiales bacterium]|nr:cytochrome c-type biogenesis protein [Burkholderiales bacterium]
MNSIANKVFAVFIAAGLSVAVLAAEDPILDKRVMEVATELRCLVCQNQTLADSNAGLAVDLRNQIREQLARGASEREVLDFMVARYGDFVLYRPPLKASTWLLWFGPFALLILGIYLLIRRIGRQRSARPELTEAERLRAEQLLKE